MHAQLPLVVVYPDAAASKLLQSCPILCDHIDGSPPGSPVPGILQARTLEGVAISFSISVPYHTIKFFRAAIVFTSNAYGNVSHIV